MNEQYAIWRERIDQLVTLKERHIDARHSSVQTARTRVRDVLIDTLAHIACRLQELNVPWDVTHSAVVRTIETYYLMALQDARARSPQHFGDEAPAQNWVTREARKHVVDPSHPS